jgi:hypothetical protein
MRLRSRIDRTKGRRTELSWVTGPATLASSILCPPVLRPMKRVRVTASGLRAAVIFAVDQGAPTTVGVRTRAGVDRLRRVQRFRPKTAAWVWACSSAPRSPKRMAACRSSIGDPCGDQPLR